MNKKRVSIKDIAELTGVTHPTVSRALRGQGRMSDATRARIVAVAEEMGYTPSLIGRGLVNQRSDSVGLVMTNFADPFHSEIAQGIEEEALRHGYSIFLASTTVDPQREMEVVRSFQGRQVDGIIVSSGRVGNQYADILQESGIPIVLINTHAEGDNIHTIVHDDREGATQITRHLLACGYQRIAFLGNQRAGKVQVERRRGWEMAMREAGLEPNLVVMGPNGRLQGGALAGHTLLALAAEEWGGLPEAIFCYNDTMAIGAVSTLRQAGIRAPEQIGITGFDDIDMAAYMDPPLTTWRQPRREMGITAMRLMLELLNRDRESTVHELERVMHGELIVRRSTQAIPSTITS